jgi:glycosyltransferase involved in cell wall biosynthesis
MPTRARSTEGHRPALSVIVPARNASATIGQTLERLARQDVDVPYEVIVVDDGSDDATAEIARNAPGSPKVVRGPGQGAAEARNRGAAEARAELLAFTDADCAPTSTWLAAGLRALDDADLVQGPVAPTPGARLGPFDHSLWVDRETGFYESANLFVRRATFEGVGGFEGWVMARGRPFAEDVWFGWRVVRAGARTRFEPSALVHHAVIARGPREWLAERARLRFFPAIAKRVPEFRSRALWHGLFLTPRSAAFDLALAGLAGAAVVRSRPLLAASLPYAYFVATESLRWRRAAPTVAAVRVAGDALGCAALVAGSIRWRSPVL